MSLKLAICGALLCVAAGTAAAQEGAPLSAVDQKSVRVVRTATPPVIDGDLGDDAWAAAAVVDDLHQVSPIEYAEPYERTEVLILYDDDALYVAARLYDTDPELITARNLRQNDNIGQDDRFYVTIDPFNDRRSGYFFGLNPNGVRADGLYRNVTEFYGDWDTIFDAAAGRFEDGWTAEIEIPFKSISFDPTTDTWGLNFSRTVVRKNEIIAWVSRNRAYNPSVSGLAVGFEGLRQGIGLEVVPSAAATNRKVFASGSTESDIEPSLDLAYRLTPQMNASLTINTDFSATEVDDRQVNLTRFGLFFPEKRDFFLREADIFEFGGIGGQRQSQIPGLNALSQNGRPFFSRRIGLSQGGEVVDLEYGGKISGRVGRWELGALSIRQDAFGTVASDNLSVVRAKRGVLRESNVGVITTEGNPTGNGDNSLAGADFLYRNTRLPGGRSLEADVWYQQSDKEGIDDEDAAYGMSLRLPTAEGFRGTVQYRAFERNFDPALGFINRRGVSDTYLNLGYMLRKRDGYLESWLFNFDYQRVESIDGGLQTEAFFLRPFTFSNRTGDSIMLAISDFTEVLAEPFQIHPGIELPPGEYDSDTIGIQLGTGSHRNVYASARFVRYPDGRFYGGSRSDQWVELTWRPSARFRANVSYELNEIDLPQGSFETRLLRAGFDIAFSPTLSWVNLIQYDNVSEVAGINSRLHWIPEAGREVYFVINHNVADPDRDNRFHSTFSDATAKVNYTFRF
ncbi:MAG: carbohydrate binding family 9 domain-containing protein [Gammaproteobacteria bacterium]|nr:carbohydrate binding family 9 domain-containing protein [Gammaproteobacteria bacterium]